MGERSRRGILGRFLRALRRRPTSKPPRAGVYRTRPPVEPEPVARTPRRPSPRRQALGHCLLAAGFVATGVLMALHPHRPEDRLWGLCCVFFFGLCLWVFVEQLALGRLVLLPSSRGRMCIALGLAGTGLAYAEALAFHGVCSRV
jgi:hypothetical protein